MGGSNPPTATKSYQEHAFACSCGRLRLSGIFGTLDIRSKKVINLTNGGDMSEKKKLKVSLSTMPPPDEIYWRFKNTDGKFEPVPNESAYLTYDDRCFTYRLVRY